MLDRHFFKQYQKQLLWILNKRFGKWLFCVDKGRSSVGENRIVEVAVNYIRWINSDGTYSVEFRTHAKYSKRLNILLSFFPFFIILFFSV